MLKLHYIGYQDRHLVSQPKNTQTSTGLYYLYEVSTLWPDRNASVVSISAAFFEFELVNSYIP